MVPILQQISSIKHAVKGLFKGRIGTNYYRREHQYYNSFTGRIWFEKF